MEDRSTMGGSFSVPDPAAKNPVGGRPQQPGGAPMAKSLCQRICDFSMKVKTTWNIPPTRSQDESKTEDFTWNLSSRRSFSFRHIENSPKVVYAAITDSRDNQDRGSDFILRWDRYLMEMEESGKSQTGGKEGITSIDSDNSDNGRSNPLGDTDTSLVEISPKGVAATITESRDSQDHGSVWIHELDLEMQELLKSQTEGKRGITLIDSDISSHNGRSEPLGDADTSLVKNSLKGVSVAITDQGSDLIPRFDEELQELVEKLTNAEAVTTVTIEDKKSGVEGSEVARKSKDSSSGN